MSDKDLRFLALMKQRRKVIFLRDATTVITLFAIGYALLMGISKIMFWNNGSISATFVFALIGTVIWLGCKYILLHYGPYVETVRSLERELYELMDDDDDDSDNNK